MTFLSRGLRLHTFVLVGVVLALLLLGGFASGSAYAAIKQHVVQPVHQVQPTSIRVGNGPLAVAMGDFNGDGKLDLVTVNEKDGTVSVLANLIDNTVSILLGKGNGAYSSNTVRVTGDDITAIAGTSFTCPVASVIGAE